MPYQVVTDPKTGKTTTVVTGFDGAKETLAPAESNPVTKAIRSIPVLGVSGDTVAAAVTGAQSGLQTLLKTGDIGKAATAYQQGFMRDISTNASPLGRMTVKAARDLTQNLLGNLPADEFARTGLTKPRMAGAPDAPILGVMPALPKVQTKSPVEDWGAGFIQGGMALFLASRGLRAGGAAVARAPGARAVAEAVQPLTQGVRTAAAFAKGAPGAAGLTARVATKGAEIIAKGAVAGAVVDYAGFDPGSERLSDQAIKWIEKQSGTPLHGPLVDLVRSAPGDTAADARWKNAVEGALFLGPAMGVTIEALGRTAKAIVNAHKARQATRPPEPTPEPAAAGQTVDVSATPVTANGVDPKSAPGVNPPPQKTKGAAPDIAKAYMDTRPRTPLWEKKGVEVQGRLDDPWADPVAADADLGRAIADTEVAVAKASSTVPDDMGAVPTAERGNVMPSYSQVRETRVADIGTDPVRLQFKAAGQGKGKRGVSGSLKDAKSYDPLFGKIVSVWRDPQTGQLLVVNGHNRLDLARRSGRESILTWEIDAPTAEEARAIGAMENIAEGQGTAWDAAKIMRDMGIDGEEMARRNIDVTKGVAEKGVALSRLPQEIFEQGATGKLSLDKAVALGSVKLDDVVVRDVAAQAAKKNWPADKILQAMQEAKFAQTAEATGGGVLPGFEDMFKSSNFEQLLDIRTEAFKALREEMVALTSVAREGRRGILEAAGNVVDVAGSQAARGQAAVAVEIFDRVTGYTGPVRDLLNEMAGQVSAKRSAKAVVTENLERLRAAIETEGGKPRLPLEQPAAAAVAPSVPSAGTSAPAAAATPTAAFADPLSAENLADARLTLGLPPTANLDAIAKAARGQGYDAIQWTGTAGTPGGKGGQIDLRKPAAAPQALTPETKEAQAADRARITQPEPEGPRPVDPAPGPDNSDDWVRRFAQQLEANRQALLDGTVTMEDLMANNFQKVQSPSGSQQYTATRENLVDGMNAMSKVLPDRATQTGRPSSSREEMRAMNQAWFDRHGEDGAAINRGLEAVTRGFDEYELGALNRAMALADKKQVEASMEAAMWLNSANVDGVNQSERLARLITAAESARATHEAVMRVTRPWGQLGAEMQVARDYEIPPATGAKEAPAPATPDAPVTPEPPIDATGAPQVVDVEAQIVEELQAQSARPIEETITGKIDEDLVAAANGGEITPKAQAAADALAQALVSAGAEPAMRNKFWRRFDEVQKLEPNALLMLRTNNLISSGVTATTNLTNGLLNLARLPLSQAGGALAQGELKRAMYSMMMFQQYWTNLSNAMRLAGHAVKAGRSLMNLDVSTMDYMDRIAQQEAQGDLLSGPGARTGWTINTVDMSQQFAQTTQGQLVNRLWQVLGTGASRLALGIDTFNSTLAGYAYEHVRHLPRGMELATERGMKEFSAEAWKFAQQYADARTQETMKEAVINGKNLADVAMESPRAKDFMNAINFTDNVWAELETRTLANGISIGQSRGLAGNDLQDFAKKYVDEGQLQHRLANFALNGPVAFGRLGSLPGEAMATLSNARLIGPVFKFIQPFQRVPSNIIKSAMRNTPAALFVDTWWRDVVSEDAFTRDRAIGEIAVGSSAMALVAMASGMGYLRFNGGGPIDPAAREKWTNIEKRMPYSIQFWDEAAGKWTAPTSMRALEPYATLFGAIGDYVDIANSLSTESRNRLGSSLVLTLARMSTSGLLSKSYFQGFNELYEAAFNPSKIIVGPAQRDPLARYMSRIVASMVPYSSALRAARRETDQVTRSVDPSDVGGLMGFFQETLDEVRNAVPGWSSALPARRDWINGSPILAQGILGAEIIPAEMPWLQAAMQFTPLAAFQQGRQILGPVHEEMGRLSGKGTNFMGPRAADFGTEMRLTASELEEYTIRFATVKDEYGRTFEQSATQLIESPQYQSWPVDGPSSKDVSLRAAAIQAEIQRYKKLAKEDFKAGTPKGQLIAAEEAEAAARKAENTYIQRYGMDNTPQPAQPGAPWSPTPR